MLQKNTKDVIVSLCKKRFNSCKIFYNEIKGYPVFILTIKSKTDTSKFEEDVKNLYFDKVFYDIVRV